MEELTPDTNAGKGGSWETGVVEGAPEVDAGEGPDVVGLGIGGVGVDLKGIRGERSTSWFDDGS